MSLTNNPLFPYLFISSSLKMRCFPTLRCTRTYAKSHDPSAMTIGTTPLLLESCAREHTHKLCGKSAEKVKCQGDIPCLRNEKDL